MQKLTGQIKAAADKQYTATFVISAVDGDRVNDLIELDALKANAGKTIPALFAHAHDKIVGAWENLRIEGDKLVADLRCASTKYGKAVQAWMDESIPLMSSIGFSGQGKRNSKGGTTFGSIDIYEASIVAVGMNRNAVRIKAIADEFGIEDFSVDSDLQEHVLEREVRLFDVRNRQAAAIEKANALLGNLKFRKGH